MSVAAGFSGGESAAARNLIIQTAAAIGLLFLCFKGDTIT